MLQKDEALLVAEHVLDVSVRPKYDEPIVICSCDEYPGHWVFGYNTRAFVADGNLRRSLIGNGPVVVPKSGDSPWRASSAVPVAKQLEDLGNA